MKSLSKSGGEPLGSIIQFPRTSKANPEPRSRQREAKAIRTLMRDIMKCNPSLGDMLGEKLALQLSFRLAGKQQA